MQSANQSKSSADNKYTELQQEILRLSRENTRLRNQLKGSILKTELAKVVAPFTKKVTIEPPITSQVDNELVLISLSNALLALSETKDPDVLP